MIDLATPWALLLAPLPLLLRALLRPAPSDAGALRVPFFDEVSGADHHPQQPLPGGQLPRLTAAVAWLLLVLAAADPRWQGDAVSLPVSGRDLLLAVDISGSMEQPDLDLAGQQLTRLRAVKRVASRFIEQRHGDRLGLILFGSQAYLQTPLTFDRATVGTLLDEAQIGLAGKETAIGDAIGLAIKRLRPAASDAAAPADGRSGEQRVLVLLTDGANTAGEVDARHAAELAASYNIRIHTVGVGSDSMRTHSLLFGTQTVNPSAGLDEETLQFIATTTGGIYFRAKDVAGLEQVYAEIDRLEPTVRDHRLLRPVTTLFHWPLALALLLSAALGLHLSRR